VAEVEASDRSLATAALDLLQTEANGEAPTTGSIGR
jgi:hypothetical protein